MLSDYFQRCAVFVKYRMTDAGRIWDVVVSPEFGRQMDLQLFHLKLVAKMELDLSRNLDYTCEVHTDTGHHHLHLTIQGVDKDGKEVRFGKDYLKHGLRKRAQALCTAQLGHRL